MGVPILPRPGATGQEDREPDHLRRQTGSRANRGTLPGAAVLRQPPPARAVPIAAAVPAGDRLRPTFQLAGDTPATDGPRLNDLQDRFLNVLAAEGLNEFRGASDRELEDGSFFVAE